MINNFSSCPFKKNDFSSFHVKRVAQDYSLCLPWFVYCSWSTRRDSCTCWSREPRAMRNNQLSKDKLHFLYDDEKIQKKNHKHIKQIPKLSSTPILTSDGIYGEKISFCMKWNHKYYIQTMLFIGKFKTIKIVKQEEKSKVIGIWNSIQVTNFSNMNRQKMHNHDNDLPTIQ